MSVCRLIDDLSAQMNHTTVLWKQSMPCVCTYFFSSSLVKKAMCVKFITRIKNAHYMTRIIILWLCVNSNERTKKIMKFMFAYFKPHSVRFVSRQQSNKNNSNRFEWFSLFTALCLCFWFVGDSDSDSKAIKTYRFASILFHCFAVFAYSTKWNLNHFVLLLSILFRAIWVLWTQIARISYTAAMSKNK